MDRFCMLLLVGLVAVVPALGATSCKAGEQGECAARDSEDPLAEEVEAQTVNLLQGRMKVQEHQQEADDEDGLSIDERHMLDEEEEAALAQKDEEEEESLLSPENSKCQPCDTACLTKDNQESFVECDSDKNSKLTVKEVQACFHTTGVALTELVSISDAEAVRFVEGLDEDGDKELTQAEFAKSIPQCEASLVEEVSKERVISTTTVNCIDTSKVLQNVAQNVKNGCSKKVAKESCSLLEKKAERATEKESTTGRRRRKGFSIGRAVKAVAHVVRCVTSYVTVAFDCVKTVAVTVTKQVGQTFKTCFAKIRSSALGNLKDKAPFNVCDSAKDCLNKLKSLNMPDLRQGISEVTSQAGDVFKNIIDGVANKLQSVMKSFWKNDVSTMLTHVKSKVSALGQAFQGFAKAFVEFGKAAVQGIKENSNIGDRCSSGGFGLIYFNPTDCGAFTKLAEMSGNNLHQWGNIISSAISKFGTCFAKRALLSIPTPFLDLALKQLCVWQPIWTVLGGLVGTFRWAIKQLVAGANGCKNDNAPVCQLMNSLSNVANTLASTFSSSFMQKSAELVSDRIHGDASHYALQTDDSSEGFAVKCVKGTADFGMFLFISAKMQFSPWQDTIKLGVKFAWGCRSGTFVFDVMFGTGWLLFLAGYVDPTEWVKPKKTTLAIDVGFSVSTPKQDIVQWIGGFTLAGAGQLGPFEGGLALTFKLLPNPNYPTGFAGGPKITLEIALQETEAETAEETFYKTTEGMVKEMGKLDLGDSKHAAKMMSSLAEGADAMVGHRGMVADLRLDSIAFFASLGVDFCITCGIGHGGTKGIISGVDTGDGAQVTASGTYSLGPRRRRSRRRAATDYGVTPGRTVALKGGRDGRWCADEYNNIKCNRGGIGQWERFYVQDAGGGRRGLRGGRNNRWCADEHNVVKCNRNGIGQWEKFAVVDAGGGRAALKGGRDNRYCADEHNTVKCNRNGIGQWEKFEVHNIR